MSDVSELVGRLRGPIKHTQQSVSLRLEAADALETLAGEVAQWRELADKASKEAWECVKLAKQMAPVVEAARQEVASGMCQSVGLIDAIATLEAAHD